MLSNAMNLLPGMQTGTAPTMNLIGQQPMGQLPGQQFMNTGQQIPGVMAPVGVPVMNFGGGVDPQQ